MPTVPRYQSQVDLRIADGVPGGLRGVFIDNGAAMRMLSNVPQIHAAPIAPATVEAPIDRVGSALTPEALGNLTQAVAGAALRYQTSVDDLEVRKALRETEEQAGKLWMEQAPDGKTVLGYGAMEGFDAVQNHEAHAQAVRKLFDERARQLPARQQALFWTRGGSSALEGSLDRAAGHALKQLQVAQEQQILVDRTSLMDQVGAGDIRLDALLGHLNSYKDPKERDYQEKLLVDHVISQVSLTKGDVEAIRLIEQWATQPGLNKAILGDAKAALMARQEHKQDRVITEAKQQIDLYNVQVKNKEISLEDEQKNAAVSFASSAGTGFLSKVRSLPVEQQNEMIARNAPAWAAELKEYSGAKTGVELKAYMDKVVAPQFEKAGVIGHYATLADEAYKVDAAKRTAMTQEAEAQAAQTRLEKELEKQKMGQDMDSLYTLIAEKGMADPAVNKKYQSVLQTYPDYSDEITKKVTDFGMAPNPQALAMELAVRRPEMWEDYVNGVRPVADLADYLGPSRYLAVAKEIETDRQAGVADAKKWMRSMVEPYIFSAGPAPVGKVRGASSSSDADSARRTAEFDRTMQMMEQHMNQLVNPGEGKTGIPPLVAAQETMTLFMTDPNLSLNFPGMPKPSEGETDIKGKKSAGEDFTSLNPAILAKYPIRTAPPRLKGDPNLITWARSIGKTKETKGVEPISALRARFIEQSLIYREEIQEAYQAADTQKIIRLGQDRANLRLQYEYALQAIPASESEYKDTVKDAKAIDADTIKGETLAGEKTRSRQVDTNAPEKDTKEGAEMTTEMRSALDKLSAGSAGSRDVQTIVTGLDKYGRTLASMRKLGINLNNLARLLGAEPFQKTMKPEEDEEKKK